MELSNPKNENSEDNFPSLKSKKTRSKNISYILRNGTL